MALSNSKLQQAEGGLPYLLVHRDMEMIDMSHMMIDPPVIRQVHKFRNYHDYIAYILYYRQHMAATFWSGFTLTTIMDYHRKYGETNVAGHCAYQLKFSAFRIRKYVGLYTSKEGLPKIYHATI